MQENANILVTEQSVTKPVKLTRSGNIKRKYDARGGARENAGRPKTRERFKSLGINTAHRVLVTLRYQKEWVELYSLAKEAKNYGYCIEILKYLTDRRDGKPFTAENPLAGKSADSMQNDPKLQVAINTLLIDKRVTNTSPAMPAQVIDIKQLEAKQCDVIQVSDKLE